MNCKPGDLAVVVRAQLGENLGRVLTVLRLATAKDLKPFNYSVPESPIWLTDTPIPKVDGKTVPLVYDREVRPIRDQPGNEQFVTELRNKLPRSKPATTKQDTINERGELA